MKSLFLITHNGNAEMRENIPILNNSDWKAAILKSGGRLCSLFSYPKSEGELELLAALGFEESGELGLIRTAVTGDSFLSLTSDFPEAHLFEREIWEQQGIRPSGHPWLKPVRYVNLNSDQDPAVTSFFTLEGEETHEVAVGPVHAGIIEPGHFRFQCHGENVIHLECALGYQHRGVEQALIGGPDKRSLFYIETLAGDSTVGHATVYSQAIEALSGLRVSPRAKCLRAIALELERIANHIGDLGGMAADVGFLPTASHCGKFRGDFLNMTAMVCGNRLGRSWIRPGGVAYDISQARAQELALKLDSTLGYMKSSMDLFLNSPSVQARFEKTGVISQTDSETLGLVGLIARACGIYRDVRYDFPSGFYKFSQILPVTWSHGDVYSRALVRWLEIKRSAQFIIDSLQHLPNGVLFVPPKELRPNSCVVSLTEGWRGEICHVALTDNRGNFSTYKIVDPSFHNWMGLAMAMRGQQISDFPLCNKSFNLSYCGHDL